MKRQKGLGAIAAIIVLVILASMAAAIVSISTTQQMSSAQDVLSARAWQAARAGNEWGLYKALKGSWSTCSGVSETLAPSPIPGLNVTVYCDSKEFNEGEDPPGTANKVRFYEIRAVACSASSCPSATASEIARPGYVERTRVVLATSE